MMNLSVWDPFQEMESLLDKYRRSSRKTPAKRDDQSFEVSDWMPVVDINETANAFIIRAELPGVEKDDVSVAIEDNTLTIKGEKKYQHRDEKNHRLECSYGSFTRSFALPRSVNVEQIAAAYKNGILSLTVPKAEAAKPKQIEVKVN